MENTVSAAEVDPLKRTEDGSERPSSTELKKKSFKDVLGFAKLTHWRTAVFFLSLFLCLTIVFAFSFIIPCPVRPQYLISWNRTFLDAGLHNCRFLWLVDFRTVADVLRRLLFSTATYDFLATEDTNRDKVKDILFVLRSSEVSQNNTCTGAGKTSTFNNTLGCTKGECLCVLFKFAPFFAFAGLPSPCVFFIAVDGTDGSALWECPLSPEFHWAQCGLDQDASRKWDCLLSHSDQLSAIDKYTGG